MLSSSCFVSDQLKFLALGDKMNAPILVARKDHEGIILDLLDDILLAEKRGTALVDRLDSITRRKSLRVIDIEMFLWIVASVAIVACFIGMVTGYILHGLLLTR
jgi:hypothetical protein